MEFKLEQLYWTEGYKPICIQVDVHYTIESGYQNYLWPVRLLVKGRLAMCDKEHSKINYLPIKHFKFFLSISILNVLACMFGFILHFIKLLAFILAGKVRMYMHIIYSYYVTMIYNTVATYIYSLNIVSISLLLLESTRLCHKETS